MNSVGILWLLAGLLLLIAELFIFTFGLLAISGFIAVAIGLLFLANLPIAAIELTGPHLWGVILLGTLVVSFIGILGYLAIKSFRRKVAMGKEVLVGMEGAVLKIYPDHIVVRVQGEIWKAAPLASSTIGQKVRVVKVSGLLLTVEPISGS